MPRTIYYLVKASGNSGVSGQTFLGHVTGAASGVGCKTSDYYLNGATLDQDTPGQGGNVTYDSPQSWILTFQLQKGSRFHHIQRTDLAALDVNMDSDGVSVTGASATITSKSISSTQLGFTLNLSSQPRTGSQPASNIAVWTNPGSYGDGKWFVGYTYPTLAPVGTAESIEFFFHTTSSPGGGTNVRNYDVYVHYVPDNGPYNPTLIWHDEILMRDRGTVLSDFEIEWSRDGVNVHGSGNYFTRLQSVAYENFSVYYRYRYVGAVSWSAWQQVQWVDPRI